MFTPVLQRLGAGPKARPVEVLRGESVRLPGGAGGGAAAAAAGAADGARAAGDAIGLRDDEGVGALRRGRDDVARRGPAADLDLAGARADVQARRRQGAVRV